MTDSVARGPEADHDAGDDGGSTLDGTWAVRRVSGLLPPRGITKRIAGGLGTTLVLGVPFARFAVVEGTAGRGSAALEYRRLPIRDELELRDGTWHGVGLLLGRRFCRFMLEAG